MSNLAAFVALWLFSSSATAQIVSIDCTLTSVYSWAYNSLNQSPCRVSAYLESTCAGGSFTVDPLGAGQEYVGPTVLGGGDICKCNTVVYSLMSACGACQNAFWIDWPTWSSNCSRVPAPGTFPNPVPQGTYVPQWALADVTRESLSLWDSVTAMGIGDSPEIAPGQLIGGGAASTTINSFGPTGPGSGLSTTFPAFTTPTPSPLSPSKTSSQSSSSSPTPSPKTSSSNTAAIVGGTVGGVAVIAVAAVVAFFMRRPRPQAPSSEYIVDPSPQPYYASQNPLSDDGTNMSSMIASEAPTAPMRLYDPNDSTTYPGYKGPSPSIPDSPQTPFTPYSATGNLMANTQTSSHLQGYSGLPTV